MAYFFDPQHTRAAHQKLALAFPLENAPLPAGLKRLFWVMANMSFEEAQAWAPTLALKDLDLLCDHYLQAPGARELLILALVLIYRNDQRQGQVVRHWVHRMPAEADLRYFRNLWHKRGLGEQTILEPKWLRQLMDLQERRTPLAFLKAYLRECEVKANEFAEDFIAQAPLFSALTDFLFAEGGELITVIPPPSAAQAARTYLERGDDERLVHFLYNYPMARIAETFFTQLAAVKGPPDPSRYPFYKAFQTPQLWGLRGRIFLRTIEAAGFEFQPRRVSFWREWLHRCQNWQLQTHQVIVTLAPLIFYERLETTIVATVEQPGQTITTIPFDYEWPRRMQALMTEYVGWGGEA